MGRIRIECRVAAGPAVAGYRPAALPWNSPEQSDRISERHINAADHVWAYAFPPARRAGPAVQEQ
ncbi:hypothetical protein GCM10010361_66410 [Streptomyces olivaceiscleroticus]|uniref:Uncharacterized protein n=1 Tax=Streptomyces olivaceiscleroticus TaxID=68245 RepID=A0ABN1B7C5_9ACTN